MRSHIQVFSSILLFTALLCGGCSKSKLSSKVDVVIEVEVENLQEGDSVFITGNRPELGDWQPGSVMLTPVSNNLWALQLSVPYGSRLEYKFTLGSWEREGINTDGSNLENFTATATLNRTFRHKIDNWKSEGIPSEFVTGTVKYHLNVPGENLSPRHIIVWLPPGYKNSESHYPVLYAHDGQNLFDPYTSFIGSDWGIDEAMTELISNDSCEPIIVVGMYNTFDRSDEYGMTQKGRDYQRFVVQTVKPLIDSTYRTKPDRNNTAVMGSSMGGLVSFLLAWNYPDVFKQAACLSPAFFTNAVDLVRDADAIPDGMRIYMDNGTVGLEAELQVMCDDMMNELAKKKYKPGHPDFEWYLDEGAEHNEPAWSARIDRPLLFMFGKDRTAATEP